MTPGRTLSSIATILLCAFSLAACGGGSSDSSAAGPVALKSDAQAPAVARWTPIASDTWQWQIKGKVNTSYNVAIYDIDLFDVDAAAIARLQQAGRKVVCYFSAGSSEDWRPDYGKFKDADKGNPVKKSDDDGNWDGENWLDVRSSNVRSIMTARLDLAVSKGCNGVEPDNVDGYQNDSGFPLTDGNQADYNTFIANEAHKRNLAVGLKNDVDQLALLAPLFEFAVNEECHDQGECDKYSVFTSKNKPVLNAEYADQYRTANGQRTLCADARAKNLRTLVLALDLDDSYRFSCDAPGTGSS
ncbi:endo alpha-1,4 polygalactosaminidase [Paraburkholderia flava]|uniref:endo alpha-1,4 polygalactosaminidase n=1 Tax=Paraburkholderia flava TaxID=2547393 RepID=UPI001061DB0C|nr:endo alpha-1,4 polygalactosaminidase [Paraburkholderia flava]